MRQLITAFFLLILASSCSTRQDKVKSFAKSLDTYFAERFPADSPGVAVVVGRPGDKILFSMGYGVEDLKSKTPITANSVFNVGSVTKTMIGIGILQLQQEGKLSIEDPLLKYFPEFKNKELVKDIKLKHLLSHTSGLPDIRPVSRDSVFYLTANDAQNFAPLFEVDSLLFAPGSRFEYSNPAFNGLALIIEKLAGKKWQERLRDSIFKKAEMWRCTFTEGSEPDQNVAHGYQKVNNQWQEYDYGEYPTFCASGNGGAWCSAEALFRYEEAILQHKLLNPELTTLARSIFKPENWKDSQPPIIGFDWFIRPLEGWNSVGHTGDQGGFRADYVYFPEQRYFIALLSNGSHDLAPLRKKIVEELKKLE